MLKDVVRAVLAAIPEIQAERDCLDRAAGIIPTEETDLFTDRSTVERTFEENTHEEELEQRLLAFGEESLLKAEALMYYGRDCEPCTFHGKLDYLRSRRVSKTEIVRTIMEKIPACGGYFENAQRKLQEENISLEDIE